MFFIRILAADEANVFIIALFYIRALFKHDLLYLLRSRSPLHVSVLCPHGMSKVSILLGFTDVIPQTRCNGSA